MQLESQLQLLARPPRNSSEHTSRRVTNRTRYHDFSRTFFKRGYFAPRIYASANVLSGCTRESGQSAGEEACAFIIDLVDSDVACSDIEKHLRDLETIKEHPT